ncbi:MAG: hypothetical protein A3E31_17920 [Candidatus Rokubacteria bacterium RIFCSPHIGHO2_12_FULL_73_22]|nr:MAG: hypothetical protein A3D33_20995 [Candidatus Rokubacteria bacterium RIFCSPHIGHO2_02_FULL_73_26]OGL04429.1 MAG: hypothetical protein A3E31_17920 [Candidatus Rokubacteria bacterium RIFCSPHIGHO2_12_FULL_73_22]OGL12626.1 MAG: hypothetical protein A3I14_00895 [Candidatus Rokubacteria bacterium RIFCSPLOWO2_02_FULL_73_56]OGL30133.1 MAG: hypothetical protein A3G44_00600 [Candidatus Rokubacteria bacterium RIFCSPLOWO2_12_FULL_73_47]
MSAVPGVVPSRRPGPLRVSGFVAVLVAVSWALGAFSAWPWTVTAPGSARLRISLRHVTGFHADVRTRSAEELAKLPAHMRPKDASVPVTGRRADAVLSVRVDGRPALTRTYRPTGLRRNGPVYAYEELALAPGRHVVGLTLTDAGSGRAWPLDTAIEFAPGRAPLVEFVAGAGWHSD